jgi:hypothetical protein
MALLAVEDAPFSDRFERDSGRALRPSRHGFSVEGYRDGARTFLFLQGTFDPAMADDLRLFLADLVDGSRQLVVDLDGITFLGTIGPSGLELKRQPAAGCRRDDIGSEATRELRLVLESLCVSEAPDNPEGSDAEVVVVLPGLHGTKTHEAPTREEVALRPA